MSVYTNHFSRPTSKDQAVGPINLRCGIGPKIYVDGLHRSLVGLLIMGRRPIQRDHAIGLRKSMAIGLMINGVLEVVALYLP